ncbi:hypothetical protein J4Q44_G00002330, partial [Coregonus suidteri]
PSSSRPPLLQSWRAHEGAIVSVEVLVYTERLFFLSGSVDGTTRMWTVEGGEGGHVGSFGQEPQWSLTDPATHHTSRDQLNDLADGEKEEREEKSESESDQSQSSEVTGQKSAIFSGGHGSPAQCLYEGPVEEAPTPENQTGPVEEVPTPENQTGPVEEAPTPENQTGPVEEVPTQENQTGPVEEAPTPENQTGPVEEAPTPENQTGPVEEAQTPENQTGPVGTQESRAPSHTQHTKVSQCHQLYAGIQRKMAVRSERRQVFGDINVNKIFPIGGVCTPFQALAVQDCQEVFLLDDLPMSPWMQRQALSCVSDAGLSSLQLSINSSEQEQEAT